MEMVDEDDAPVDLGAELLKEVGICVCETGRIEVIEVYHVWFCVSCWLFWGGDEASFDKNHSLSSLPVYTQAGAGRNTSSSGSGGTRTARTPSPATKATSSSSSTTTTRLLLLAIIVSKQRSQPLPCCMLPLWRHPHHPQRIPPHPGPAVGVHRGPLATSSRHFLQQRDDVWQHIALEAFHHIQGSCAVDVHMQLLTSRVRQGAGAPCRRHGFDFRKGQFVDLEHLGALS